MNARTTTTRHKHNIALSPMSSCQGIGGHTDGTPMPTQWEGRTSTRYQSTQQTHETETDTWSRKHGFGDWCAKIKKKSSQQKMKPTT